MKKFLWILALAFCLSACGNETDFLTEDDFFFSNNELVSVMDGEVVSIVSDLKNLGDDTYAYPVSLSDDLFVFVTGSEGFHNSTLMKIVGKDIKEIYRIKDQEFLPSALVGDKVYGFFRGNVNLSKFDYLYAYGEIDLKTGKTNIFEALKIKKENEFLQSIGFTDKEIRYIKLNMSGDFKDKFYRLDLSKGYDQEPEEVGDVEGFTWLQSVKYDKDGKDNYDILDVDYDDEGKCYIKGIECPGEGTQLISAGPNIIFQIFIDPANDPYLFKMDILNFVTGEFVAEDVESYGYRVFKGKLYYLDKDKKVQVLDGFK
ncbi:hypothetical protein [Anaerococcus degeneri]|uniref:Lipoprotein n=1 Tax=Anaerococcus degeneri TaxID=361500 RepID=A0ABS7YXW5_9FIRM|nr:hypothetical protein [Anaerococcus degeneri]MBP2016220.1 hypothetical protein [Anaerococcus degeneri]MCA2096576.1 hypothetical protein [Anaerococcus degeneri]